MLLALGFTLGVAADQLPDAPTSSSASIPLSTPSEMERAVVGIHSTRPTLTAAPLPGIRINRTKGTGVCIDPPGQRCRHFVTNYHVAFMGSAPHVEGVGAHVLTAAGPHDEHATWVRVAGRRLRYDPTKDVAFLESKPLPARFHGVRFANYVPQVGQEVVVVAHHGKQFDVRRGKVLAIDALWEDGRAMRNLVVDVASRPGNSGGMVADGQGNFLGLVAFMGTVQTGEGARNVTIALRASAIYEALRSLSPAVWSAIFAGYVPPAEEPIQETEAMPALAPPLAIKLQAASPEAMVATLRDNARSLLQQMVKLVARQCWTEWKNQPPVCYEVMVGDEGHVLFREIRSDKTLGPQVEQLPLPNEYGVWPGDEWAGELSQILEQPLEYQGVTEDGRYLFSYQSQQCSLDEHYLWDRLPSGNPRQVTGYVECSGYVVSDADMNIEMVMSDARGDNGMLTEKYIKVSTYARVTLEGGKSVLAPHSLELSGKFRSQRKVFKARVEWDQYRKFRTEHTISP